MSHAVINGVVQHFSPSSLSVADPNQWGGCPTKYWFRYVAGIKEPQGKAQNTGIALHKALERFLTTGERLLDRTALAGVHYVPSREYALGVEVPIAGTLTAARVPVIGFVDLVVRAPTYITSSGDHRQDEPGTVEVIDWKTTSDLGRVKPSDTLMQSIQMPAYGQWAVHAHGAERVRLSHVYFQTSKPGSTKRTHLVQADDLAKRWEQIEAGARTVLEVAKETDPSKVPGHEPSCTAYRQCYYAPQCSAAQKFRDRKTLTALFGHKKEREMSLFPKKPDAVQATQSAPVMGVVVPATGPAPVVTLSIADQVAKLRAHETAAHAARIATPPTPVKIAMPAGFAEACKAIVFSGMGQPQISAAVAGAWAEAVGSPTVTAGAGLAGSGALAGLIMSSGEEVLTLAKEIATVAPVEVVAVSVEAPAPAPAPIPTILPPDAPPSQPALASKPPSTKPAAGPGRGHKKTDVPTSPIAQDATLAPTSDQVEIYVNAVPRGPFADLAPYVAEKCAKIAAAMKVDDIRVAGKDSPLAYGGWRGALAAVIRDEPPAPGRYVLFVATELGEVAAEALAPFVAARGVRP